MEVSNTAAISLETHLSMSKVSPFFLLTNEKNTIYYPNGRIRCIVKIPQEMCVLFFCPCLEKVYLVTITLTYVS